MSTTTGPDNMFVLSDAILFDAVQWIPALSIVASTCFIVTAFLRWHQLQESSIKVESNQQENIKFVSSRPTRLRGTHQGHRLIH